MGEKRSTEWKPIQLGFSPVDRGERCEKQVVHGVSKSLGRPFEPKDPKPGSGQAKELGTGSQDLFLQKDMN